jgi:hypothetical protein
MARRPSPRPFRNYGNGRLYLAVRLERDGFPRLAFLVRTSRLSAQFAIELAKTVPPEHLDAVTDRAEIVGPRRPLWWDWQFALSLPIRNG